MVPRYTSVLAVLTVVLQQVSATGTKLLLSKPRDNPVDSAGECPQWPGPQTQEVSTMLAQEHDQLASANETATFVFCMTVLLSAYVLIQFALHRLDVSAVGLADEFEGVLREPLAAIIPSSLYKEPVEADTDSNGDTKKRMTPSQLKAHLLKSSASYSESKVRQARLAGNKPAQLSNLRWTIKPTEPEKGVVITDPFDPANAELKQERTLYISPGPSPSASLQSPTSRHPRSPLSKSPHTMISPRRLHSPSSPYYAAASSPSASPAARVRSPMLAAFEDGMRAVFASSPNRAAIVAGMVEAGMVVSKSSSPQQQASSNPTSARPHSPKSPRVRRFAGFVLPSPRSPTKGRNMVTGNGLPKSPRQGAFAPSSPLRAGLERDEGFVDSVEAAGKDGSKDVQLCKSPDAYSYSTAGATPANANWNDLSFTQQNAHSSITKSGDDQLRNRHSKMLRLKKL